MLTYIFDQMSKSLWSVGTQWFLALALAGKKYQPMIKENNKNVNLFFLSSTIVSPWKPRCNINEIKKRLSNLMSFEYDVHSKEKL